MARWKKSIVTLLCSVVVLSITPVNAAESISIPLDEQVLQQDSASTKEKLDSILETSVTQAVYAAENNPYIEQYLIEQEADPNENYLGNPEEEEKIALEALNIIYKEDIKVGELLAKLTENDEMIKKATSLNRDRIIEVLHIIVDNFFKVDESEKDLLLGYMERYAVNVGDKASIELYHENKKNYDSAKISPFASYDRSLPPENGPIKITINTVQITPLLLVDGEVIVPTLYLKQCMLVEAYPLKVTGMYTKKFKIFGSNEC